MGTSDTLDDEFGFDLWDSWELRCRLSSKKWFCVSFPYKVSFNWRKRQTQMSSISEEVFDQLIPSRTVHEIIDDTHVSFTSVKHDFSIRRKSFIKLCSRYFLSQRAKQVWLMSTIRPNNSLWRIRHDVTFQGLELFYELTSSSTSRSCYWYTKMMM